MATLAAFVVSHRETWIEISEAGNPYVFIISSLTERRGLKSEAQEMTKETDSVVSHRETWIEIVKEGTEAITTIVVSHRETWIEI